MPKRPTGSPGYDYPTLGEIYQYLYRPPRNWSGTPKVGSLMWYLTKPLAGDYNNLLTAGNPPTTPTTPATQIVPATATTPTNPPTTPTNPPTTPTVPNLFGNVSAPGLSTNALLNPLAGFWNQMYGGEELQPGGAEQQGAGYGQPDNQPGDMWWSGERTAEGGPNINRDWWSQLGKNYGLNWGTEYGPNPWGGAGNWQQPTANLNEQGEVVSYNNTRNQWGQPVGTPGFVTRGGKRSPRPGRWRMTLATHDWASTIAKEQAELDRAIAQGAPADRIKWMQERLAKFKDYQSKYGGGGQPTGGYQTYTPNWYNNLTTWKSKG